ncbi:MAG: hypothetical protein ISR75_05770 [Phycisphaerales bacterium]|nr:hypothetical protein [Planctomycetota bacterium]MBL6997927.1 hypothetical protein [Phycisphaerales bacterium]
MITQARTLITLLSLTAFLASSFAVSAPQEANWADSVVETESEGTSILIIPMDGQMHTDIRADLYKGLTERIKEANPDLIIVELYSRDRKNNFAYLMGYGDPNEFNPFNDNDLVDIAKVFQIQLKDIPQVLWVKDSSGASTVLSFSWPIMYMSEGAFLRATTQVADFNNIDAEDTRGKIREFRTIHSKIVAEYGDRSHALVRAFVDPDVPLSGTWKGQKVVWEENTLGDFKVDQGEDDMPQLTAITATELDISKGIVASIQDVLLAQGIRGDYHIVGKDITAEIIKNKEDWRKKLERAHELWNDALQFEEWAGSADARKNRMNELRSLKQLLNILEKSTPVEVRMRRPFRPGVTIPYLKQRIKGVEQLLEDMKGGGGRGGGRGGGGGGGRG